MKNPNSAASTKLDAILQVTDHARIQTRSGLYPKLLQKIQQSSLPAGLKTQLARWLKVMVRLNKHLLALTKAAVDCTERAGQRLLQLMRQAIAKPCELGQKMMNLARAYPWTTAGFIVGMLISALLPCFPIIGGLLKALAVVIPTAWGFLRDLAQRVVVWFGMLQSFGGMPTMPEEAKA